ncbi:protein-tyrosine phosphatase [Algoriphagus sp. 4150]|uniref:tyrosine-protein phosphatase n=1 Tax=Algoriphagus sp. 4150 TaxID=2817756 RepID=UPI0028549655|nr:tyrosine-protein phosphatase [Algoriphagus sp. 4150]MDR7131786.1 protein-tyrosine phosphatase [Algoriphagus sp. 4150]
MKTLKTLILSATLLTSLEAMAQKNLGLESSPNFRELGGISVGNEYRIKEDMIYRSGSFSNLPDSDKEKFAETGINTVVDFRSEFEIKREPDDIPASLEANYVGSQIGEMDQKAMGQFMKVLNNDDFRTESLDSLMVEANKGFVTNISDYMPFFESLRRPDAVVLFHCSAGKDRTGLASSLFLHILGADWDTILADYMRSNEAVQKLDEDKLSMYGIPKDRAQYLMGVRPEYLEAAWTEIQREFGSVDAMLEKEFGIGEKEKAEIKAKYLTKI